ncbi:MAG: hypothetical protein M1831_006692 [Alyxoria varia]|nr:MAG: hypothetical protein M1831_006692 [Alyxoria varia]
MSGPNSPRTESRKRRSSEPANPHVVNASKAPGNSWQCEDDSLDRLWARMRKEYVTLKQFHGFMLLPTEIRLMIYDWKILLDLEDYREYSKEPSCPENNWNKERFMVFRWDHGRQKWPATFQRMIPSDYDKWADEYCTGFPSDELLRVSKAVRKEALDVLAANFCFEIPHIKFSRVLYVMNQTNGLAERIQHISLDVQHYIGIFALSVAGNTLLACRFYKLKSVFPSLRSTTIREWAVYRGSSRHTGLWRTVVKEGILDNFYDFALFEAYNFSGDTEEKLRDRLMLFRDIALENGEYSSSSAWSSLEEQSWPVMEELDSE